MARGSKTLVAWGTDVIRAKGLEEGHSRQPIVIPFQPCVLQMFAILILKGFPLMVGSLIANVIRHHLLIPQCVGESTILFPPACKLWE